MQIKSITSYLESIAPLSLQEEYDNSGLIVGNEEDEVQGVLICIDCTEVVIDEAIKKKCNLIIAHHPIIFKGLKKITGKNYVERVVLKAIRNNISIYAIHTNLDTISEGVNKKICEKLGLSNCKFLLPSPVTTERNAKVGDVVWGLGVLSGSGMIGTLLNPMHEIAFLNKVKKVMKASLVRHTTLLNKKIKKVAVCGGSGSFLLNDAITSGADIFVTADFKYHQFFDADNKILIADIGHYESEQFTKELLHDLLSRFLRTISFDKKKKQSTFGLRLSEINTNPIHYL